MGTINNGRREAITITHAAGTWQGIGAIAAPDEGNYLRVIIQVDARKLRHVTALTIAGEPHIVITAPFKNALVPILTEIHVNL